MKLFLFLALVLAQIPTRPAEGGTVSGILKGLDGKPLAGIRIAAVPLGDTKPLGAFLIVGRELVSGVQLSEETSVVPTEVRTAIDPAPSNGAAPGTVLDSETKERITDGKVRITGASRSLTYDIKEGRFEIPRLLPGTYTLDLDVFARSRDTRSITVGAEDLTIEMTPRKLQ